VVSARADATAVRGAGAGGVGTSAPAERNVVARPPFEVEGFVGQRAVLTPIVREQDGAIARGEPTPHSLVIGPSGIGKTELFGALARRAKVKIEKLVGKAPVKKVCDALLALRPNDFIVFDEGHSLDPAVQEMLYEVIDGREVPARCLPGGESSGPAPVAPCTIVVATDQPGCLLKALRKRLPQRVWLADYTEAEMKEIVARIAERCDVLLSPQAARLVARVSNGLPRRARDYVRSLRRYFPDSEGSQLGLPQLEEYLRANGVTDGGLTRAEIRYLRFLREEERASLDTLAASLGVDAAYVREEVEQPLLYRGLVRIGGSGRALTNAGCVRLADLPEAGEDEDDEAQGGAPVKPAGKEVARG
jgi:Holliday junction DNA helicase RuvB